MAWAIITIYAFNCVKAYMRGVLQMDLQPLPTCKTSKFYSRGKMCDIKKTLGGVGTTPLGILKVKQNF